MQSFFKQCVERYLEIAKANGVKDLNLRPVPYPAIDDHQMPPRNLSSQASSPKMPQK